MTRARRARPVSEGNSLLAPLNGTHVPISEAKRGYLDLSPYILRLAARWCGRNGSELATDEGPRKSEQGPAPPWTMHGMESSSACFRCPTCLRSETVAEGLSEMDTHVDAWKAAGQLITDFDR